MERGASGDYRWVHATRAIAPALSRWVVDLHGFVEAGTTPIRRTEFAVPYVVIVLELGPPLTFLSGTSDGSPGSHNGGFLGGVSERPATMAHTGYQEGIQINLTPPAARLWLGCSLTEFAGGTVALHDVLPPKLRGLQERLASVPDWGKRFDVVERALINQLAEPTLHTGVVEWSLRRIQARGGDQNVRELSRELGYSQKQLNRIFREWVGVSPKMHARIVRFERLMRLLRARTDRSWAELAAHLGFYDQSHLHRDVRHFAGCTPRELASLALAWPDSRGGD